MKTQIRRVEIGKEFPGRLYLHSMPGRYEALESFLKQAANAKVDVLVCLASDEEITRLSQEYSSRLHRDSFPIERIEFPIEDYDVPYDLGKFHELAENLAQSIREGKRVLVHCAAGIGRTGLTAVSILMHLGESREVAISIISEAGCEPEIGKQGEFLRDLEISLVN